MPSPDAPAAPAIPHWYQPDDPWLTDRMRQIAEITDAERQLMPALEQALASYLDAARHALGLPQPLTAAATADLAAWPERERGWLGALADFVYNLLRALFGKRFNAELTSLSNAPTPDAAADTYVTAVWQQLKTLPEMIFEDVRAESRAAAAAGDSRVEADRRVASLLDINAPSRRQLAEADTLRRTIANAATSDAVRRQAKARLAALSAKPGTRWFSKVREFARTLAVSVLNAATAAAGAIFSRLTGRTRYRQWWAVRDDRVREAHRRANGQTQPVGKKFLVGGVHMDYPGDPTAPPDLVVNCRCSLLSLGQSAGEKARRAYESGPALTAASDPRGGVGMDTDVLEDPTDQVPDQPPVLAAGTALPDELTQVGWRGVLAPMGVRSGDGRMLAPPAGAPNARNLPLPLLYQQATGPGHTNSVVVGSITRVWAQDGSLMGEGVFDLGDDTARDVVRKISSGFHRWVSVGVDDDSAEMQYWRGEQQLELAEVAMSEDLADIQAVTVFTAWRLMSATLVAEPAFQEAVIELLLDDCEDPEDPDDEVDPDAETPDAQQPVVPPARRPQPQPAMAAAPSTVDRKKAESDGAAMPGGRYPIRNADDLSKAIRAVGRAGGPNGTEAQRAEVRRWIIKRANALGLSKMIPTNWGSDGSLKGGAHSQILVADAAHGVSWYATTAAAVPMQPPAAWFQNPQLTGPTKMRVLDSGRVYGHLAPWEEEHAALPGQMAPHNPDTAYAKFHRHPVRTAEGTRVKTGPLAGFGHADKLERSLWAVQRHYDNPDYVLADVVCGEDEFGVWCAGAMRYGVTPKQVMFVDRYSFSGDWRYGELLAGCLASVPGFFLDADDEVQALVADAGDAREFVIVEAAPQMCVEDGETVVLLSAGVIPPQRMAAPKGGAVGVSLGLDPDAAEEWGKRAGKGWFAGVEAARLAAEEEARLLAEAQRDRVAMAAHVEMLGRRINAPLEREVELIKQRLGVRGGGD